MILLRHLSLWREIFSLPYLPRGDWLTIGVQDIHPSARIDDFNYPNLTEYLSPKGITVTTLDLFDPRADIRHDLNRPIPVNLRERFDMLLDVGSIEHIYDTRQAFMNYLMLVKLGGYLCIHTPIAGFFNHGLHTFSPEAVRDSLLLNGCEIVFERISLDSGDVLSSRDIKNANSLIWLVATKTGNFTYFENPQQERWKRYGQR